MTICYVTPAGETDAIDMGLAEAKKYLREHPGATAVKYHVGRDGDFECLGEVKARGSNAYRMHNASGRDRLVPAY
ncbi:MAG: hypothetical protein IJS32_01195 [Kiritimatiellae bacterium]|nr:hypothetical protein [Kiritimatiellia bacterium]